MAAQAHNGTTVVTPVIATVPAITGPCDTVQTGDFAHSTTVTIDQNINVYVERTDSDLYLCFYGIDERPLGDIPPSAADNAIAYIDPVHRAGASDVFSTQDFRVIARPSGQSTVLGSASPGSLYLACNPFTGGCGPVLSYAGSGLPSPDWSVSGGSETALSEFSQVWTAEIRISKPLLGGNWDHTIGFMLQYHAGSYGSGLTRAAFWPPQARPTQPDTWADLNLNGGLQPFITRVVPTIVKTPQALRPGTTVYLNGFNLCANNPKVQFGFVGGAVSDDALATPTACAADGSSLQVTVPRLAVSGPVSLIQTTGVRYRAVSTDTLTVQSYRNTNGFAFQNNGQTSDSFNLSDYADVFGSDKFFLRVNPCWPWFDCSFPTPIPDPISYLYFYATSQMLDNLGDCFGFILASERMINGNEALSNFSPGNATTIWQLDGPTAPSDSLHHYIKLQHLYQLSSQYIKAYVSGGLDHLSAGGSARIYDQVHTALSQNPPQYPLIAISPGGTSGHQVVAYDLEMNDTSGAGLDYYIYVYDPNQPFTASEFNDLDLHRSNEVTSGRIHVSGDNWSYSASATNWNDGIERLVPVAYSVLPKGQASMPGLDATTSGFFVIFGNAKISQVSNQAGNTLYKADGTINTDPSTRLPDAFIYPDMAGTATTNAVVLESPGIYRQTVTGTGSGTYSNTMFSPGLVAQVTNVASSPSISDLLTINPAASQFQFESGAASKEITVELIGRATDGSARTATVTTTGIQGGADALSFDNDRSSVVYQHKGTMTSFALSLSWVGTNGTPATYRSGTRVANAGDVISFTPGDWSDLLTSTIQVSTVRSDGTRQVDTVSQTPPVRLTGASEVPASGEVSFVVTATASGAAPLASIQASSAPDGPWQTVTPLTGRGPTMETATFSITDTRYGGSTASGKRIVYVRVMDRSGDNIIVARLNVTYPGTSSAATDVRYFPQTGFRISDDVIWDYFSHRGALASFGYPTSRTFTLQGFKVQFFQRRVVQLDQNGNARLLNLLDPGLMPYTSFNGSTFPGVDSALVATAPVPTSQPAILAWVREHAPDTAADIPVGFSTTFQGTVSAEAAFPSGGDAGLLPGLDLEMWGIPTNAPTIDPNNHNFVYLRWQRGIMHYDAGCHCTQGVLLADYFKAIITGQNLPPDLAQEAATSPFLNQYDSSAPHWVHNSSLLPNTDLTDAFTPESPGGR